MPTLRILLLSRFRGLCAGLLAGIVLLSTGACSLKDATDRLVENELRRMGVPGATLAVIHRGKRVKLCGYGWADAKRQIPARDDTLYEIGSLTKQFTAAAVLLLVEEGRVSLDAPLRKYVTELPVAWSRVTVRDALQHLSGIGNYTDHVDFLELTRNELSRQRALEHFARVPIEFRPGETWAYSNTAYYALGWLIEAVAGQDYWDFLAQRIFSPLGMTSTHSSDARMEGRAAGYGLEAGRVVPRSPLVASSAYAAGGILSTAGDLARWVAALESGRVLKHSTLEAAWTPYALRFGAPGPVSYGYGWFVNQYRGQKVIWHTGGTPGFSSLLFYFPEEHLIVILLANLGDRILENLAVAIAGQTVPALARPAVLPSDPQPELTGRLRRGLEGLLAGAAEAELFTPAFQRSLAATSTRGLWQWVASHGPLEGFQFAERESAGKLLLLRYRAQMGGAAMWFTFGLDESGQVAQVMWW